MAAFDCVLPRGVSGLMAAFDVRVLVVLISVLMIAQDWLCLARSST